MWVLNETKNSSLDFTALNVESMTLKSWTGFIYSIALMFYLCWLHLCFKFHKSDIILWTCPCWTNKNVSTINYLFIYYLQFVFNVQILQSSSGCEQHHFCSTWYQPDISWRGYFAVQKKPQKLSDNRTLLYSSGKSTSRHNLPYHLHKILKKNFSVLLTLKDWKVHFCASLSGNYM